MNGNQFCASIQMGGKKCRKVMIRGAAKYLQYSQFSVDADVDLLDCALPPLPPP